MERKTRYVFNEEDGSYEEVPVRGFKMTDEDRIGIVRDFLEQRMTSEEIVKRYELSSKQLLYNWVVKYMDEGNMLSLFPQITTDMDNDGKEADDCQCVDKDARIRQLEQALRLERLRSEGFSAMIDIAEKEFNIPIRKTWHQTVSLLRASRPCAIVDELCGLFGRTRQAYYKRDDEADFQRSTIETLMVECVVEYRSANPRLGSVKLYLMARKRFSVFSERFP